MLDLIGTIWTTLIIEPMINSLVLLYAVLFSNFGFTIVAFTILIRLAMFPLTVKQSRALKSMTALQPRLKEIQTKYADDRERRASETMKVYKSGGVNPLGCLGPMIIQLPIWIGLYRSILQTLPSTPESLVGLSDHLYSWVPWVHEVVPLNSSFLWLDLAVPDPFLLPVLVGASMFIMQKMTTMPSADPRQQSTNQMMLWMMPVMFGFFTTTFPSGLAVYWIVSNVVGVVMQGFITGWDPLKSLNPLKRPAETEVAPAIVSTAEETEDYERDRDDSQDNGRSGRARPKGAGRRSGRRRNRRR
ncbi:MAG: YidC/Oxa1 family membrane protein insertase [Chloroflexi bacterium]|nr:YidC/Oxa1 family membrane protein insertase [Chloroflexota bacterium]